VVRLLGLPNDVEIFPKQDALGDGELGNWINLPYFGGDRPAYGEDGRILSLAEFLDRKHLTKDS
jgi:hypothetical protein